MSETSATTSATTPVSGWSVETAMFHLLSAIADNDRRYEQRFEAQAEAVKKAETATERRFEGVNEFRAQLGDQQRTFIPRSEVDLIEKSLSEKINKANSELAAMRAEQQGVRGGWGYAVGAAGFISLLVGVGIALNAAFK